MRVRSKNTHLAIRYNNSNLSAVMELLALCYKHTTWVVASNDDSSVVISLHGGDSALPGDYIVMLPDNPKKYSPQDLTKWYEVV